MVAAMPLSTESLENKKTVTTNDLRNLALFLAGGLALLLVASQMVDSGSASATALEDTPEKRFISITTGQTANVQENSAATTTVMTVATDTTPTTDVRYRPETLTETGMATTRSQFRLPVSSPSTTHEI